MGASLAAYVSPVGASLKRFATAHIGVEDMFSMFSGPRQSSLSFSLQHSAQLDGSWAAT